MFPSFQRIVEQKELLTPEPEPSPQHLPPDASSSSSTLRVIDPLSALQKMSSSSKDESFDSIDMPLKTVKECMKRLEMQHQQNELELSAAASVLVQDNLRKNLRLDQLKPVYDEPIKKSSPLNVNVNFDQIRKDMSTVALDWDPWRSCSSCPCGTRFEITSTRSHCHCCGKIFCARCTDRLILLPGHRINTNNHKANKCKSSTTTITNLCNKPTTTASCTESSEGDVFESSDESSKVHSKGSKVNVCKSCHKLVLELE